MSVSPTNRTLTAVPGLSVGHAGGEAEGSGCTVVLGPFRAAADVRGFASGTRQFDSLNPSHVASAVDAILLTGGSAYGLAAADGVAAWLEERGRGFETDAGRVAIVPSAVIFDLAVKDAARRPDRHMGRQACEAATAAAVAEGRVGAGSGASVGKLFGRERAMPGGLGSWAVEMDEYTVGALAVVNAFGDVVDARGEILAGARNSDGSFANTAKYLRENRPPAGFRGRPGVNTTLGVVATDYPLTRTDLLTVARGAMNAIVRRTSPANTPFDGDLVFACSTGAVAREAAPATLLRIGLCAEEALSTAIVRAVERNQPSGDPTAVAD